MRQGKVHNENNYMEGMTLCGLWIRPGVRVAAKGETVAAEDECKRCRVAWGDDAGTSYSKRRQGSSTTTKRTTRRQRIDEYRARMRAHWAAQDERFRLAREARGAQ